MTGHLEAICVVSELRDDAGTVGKTAIDKRPVSGQVGVNELGLWGDIQADREHHGGTYQAVYAYSTEDAEWWASELDREIPPGTFGENLRISGLDVSGALIGERWRIADVVLEVTSPRIPCKTFARWMDEEGWLRRFNRAQRHGAYLRVVTEGHIEAGQDVEVVHRPSHGVSIRILFGDANPEAASRLLDEATTTAIDLDPEMREAMVRMADR